ncbi:MAG: hypothetical protein GDA50_04170 [Alphaproteobacteria bacterium GM202ARS2]|nr:hypothetical protein [Alphaproteobacteria bacterium GM202ARS2]
MIEPTTGQVPVQLIDVYDADFLNAEREVLLTAMEVAGCDSADVLDLLHSTIVKLAWKAGCPLEDTIKAQSRHVALAHGPRH